MPYVVLCFASPTRETVLRNLPFRNVSGIARCLGLSRTTVVGKIASADYTPIRGTDYARGQSILPNIEIYRHSSNTEPRQRLQMRQLRS